MSSESWGRVFAVLVALWVCVVTAQLLSMLGIIGPLDLGAFWYLVLGVSCAVWLARGLIELRRKLL